ncbi:odorant receptor 131-2-like [Hyla sarda]|uniref:odorant receptor 131-2-like n=1 Tax=Hyla sarda TaxID=327740 RepID=UPI0024C412F8|nr:odorant receptor 131-2-like [Hyla sarda]
MKIFREKNIAVSRMVNTSLLQSNMTQVSLLSNKLLEYTKLTIILLIILGFCFFTCFVTMILKVFFMTPHLRYSSRYVLFVYMLTNDTYFVYLGFYLVISSFYELHIPISLCFFLYSLGNIAYKVTPYSLAAMAVEQYVAICHPLRHAELYTTYRARVTFTMICSLLAGLQVIELFVMVSSITNILDLYIICRTTLLVVNPIQNVLRSINVILCFSSVGLVILVTYIKIMVVAHRISSGLSLASKAGKTVMLHAFQLLLCMASLFSSLTESIDINQVELLSLINFFLFTCVPRFLSPVIYGFRDETLRRHIKLSLAHITHNFYGKKVFR